VLLNGFSDCDIMGRSVKSEPKCRFSMVLFAKRKKTRAFADGFKLGENNYKNIAARSPSFHRVDRDNT
jgi:hypothetical protein